MRHSPSKALPRALAAALALTACEQAGPTAPPTAPLRAQAPAQSEGPQSYTTTYSYSLDGDLYYNECTGEDVRLTGTIRGVWHVSPNGNGGYRLVNNSNSAGVKGVGLTTGVQYVSTSSGTLSLDLTPGSEATITLSFLFIGRGSAADMRFISVARMRVDENGILTVLRDRNSFVCG